MLPLTMRSVCWEREREIVRSPLSSWQEVFGGFPLLVVPVGRCFWTDFLVHSHNSPPASHNEREQTWKPCFCPVSIQYRLMITWWTAGSKVKLRADRTIAGSRWTINCCSTPGLTALLTGSPEVNSSCQISKHRWEILISNLLVTQSHHKFQHNQQPCISNPWIFTSSSQNLLSCLL